MHQRQVQGTEKYERRGHINGGLTFMEPFQDKIAIVTGGASGIGRELCRQLAARGAAAVSTAYAATKHAVVGLSTSLRAEAANLGVKVSVACPAIVRTPILETTLKVSALKDGGAYPDLAAYGSIAPDRCARLILRGVARNRAIIPAGAAARLTWLLNRLSPSLMIWIYEKGSGAFQAVREEG
jgi:short-subunit dehydrogenase